MVTAAVHHAIANLDNELIMFPQIRRFLVLAFTLCLAAPLSAQQEGAKAGAEAERRPLNLSLPREVLQPPAATTRASEEAGRKTVDDERSGRWFGDQAPYGTGFEARQRGNGGFGGAGHGAGHGGGRGGRGR
jgi:hypothetical protein